MEKSLMESFFNSVADLIKRDSGTGVFLWIFRKFLKSLFIEHVRITTPADSSVPTKLLFIDDTLFLFSFIFFSFIIDNCDYGSLLTKEYGSLLKIKIILLFTTVFAFYTNVVKTIASAIICRRTLKKIQIFFDKSLGNYRAPKRISKAIDR